VGKALAKRLFKEKMQSKAGMSSTRDSGEGYVWIYRMNMADID
jgi:hypothetical protein